MNEETTQYIDKENRQKRQKYEATSDTEYRVFHPVLVSSSSEPQVAIHTELTHFPRACALRRFLVRPPFAQEKTQGIMGGRLDLDAHWAAIVDLGVRADPRSLQGGSHA
jgi:hypothetical protein